MRLHLTILCLIITSMLLGQEFKDNLFLTIKNSAIHDFHSSDFTKMTVSTQRKSTKLGFVEEANLTYRKGKINKERVNFLVKYSEYYILDDRKKSLGKYDLSAENDIVYYERTDFNSRNFRTYTYKHYLEHKEGVVENELIKTIEYSGEGASEFDTTVYVERTIYDVSKSENLIVQQNKETAVGTLEYSVEGGLLVKLTTRFEDVIDETTYHYDENKRLIRTTHDYRKANEPSLHSETLIFRNEAGLIGEVHFFDSKKNMLEKKIFSYK